MDAKTAALLYVIAFCAASCSSGSTGNPSQGDGSAESAASSSGSSGAGGSGSSGSDAATAYDAGICSTCATTEVCVEDSVSGGALILPDDAGQCPSGRVPSGGTPNVCITPPTYHCAALPSACNTAMGSTAIAHCVCAPGLCPPAYQCSDPTPVLMRCSLLAP